MLINHYHETTPVAEGYAQNIQELFNVLIKDQFSNKDAIIAQHNALIEYISQPKATYFIRLYGSFPKKNYSNLRRGFLSEYKDGNKIVFCDNTFALNFTAAKSAGLTYEVENLNEFLNQKYLVFSFGTTAEERELSYFDPKGVKRQNINPAGWTLAHIKPVGYGFNGDKLKSVFLNPDRKEWDPKNRIRKVDSNLSQKEIAVAKAHFLRLVHPLNSFLIPKNNLVQYNGKRLGEEAELINFVHQYLKEVFKTEMEELERLTMQYEFPLSTPLMDIKWFGPDKVLKYTQAKKNKDIVNDNEDSFFEEEASFKLLKTLHSIGMLVFRDFLYPVLKLNIDATIEDIINKHPEYNKYSNNSQKTRLSSSKSIFKNGLEEEALNIIANSKVNLFCK